MADKIYHCNKCWQGRPCIFKITSDMLDPYESSGLVCPVDESKQANWKRRE